MLICQSMQFKTIYANAVLQEKLFKALSSCSENVAANQLEDRIDVRLGDGLSVIHPEDVIDNITICGMGGPLIAKILKDGQDKLSQHPRLILQSNIQTENLRQTLQQLNYEIIDEIIMEEKAIFMKLL